MKMTLSVKNQSVETSGLPKDYREALCEYIWNGYEANATEVNLSFNLNATGQGIDSISITDNGEGIKYNRYGSIACYRDKTPRYWIDFQRQGYLCSGKSNEVYEKEVPEKKRRDKSFAYYARMEKIRDRDFKIQLAEVIWMDWYIDLEK